MKSLLIFTIVLLTNSFISKAQDTLVLKRTPYTLKIDVDEANVYEDKIEAIPYVFPNNSMQIYPGDTIYVEVEQDNGKIKSSKRNLKPRDDLNN